MTQFRVVKLSALVEAMGEDGASRILSSYECPRNPDIERFARERAIAFSKQGIAQTHLVLSRDGGSPELVGFFALALKVLSLPVDCMSNTVRKRYLRFGALDEAAGTVSLAAPLVAQLGKNFSSSVIHPISGDLLLAYACEMVRGIQSNLGGKLVYLECEPVDTLIAFYERNGFRRATPSGPNGGLVQMVRFL